MEIILVEDNGGDVYLIKNALKSEDIVLTVITDGGKALAFAASDCPKPDLIILDINLPHNNGFQILEAVRNCEDKKDVPIVIFSSSSSEEDIEKAYGLGASKFSSKPYNDDEYFKIVKSFLKLVQY